MLGLTGPIGAGKSTVAAMLRYRGATVLDTDALVREQQSPGAAVYEQIVAALGDAIVLADGSLDRRKLAAVAFADPGKRRWLETLTGGAVLERVRAARSGSARIVVYEAAQFGQPVRDLMDRVWLIRAPRELLVGRLEGRGVERADAERRLGAQFTDAEFRKFADRVLENTGDREDLAREVDRAWRELAIPVE